ncbi:MAG: hypothetical protein J6K45_04485 [Clostridia bacterium]|nr:hypothetical protein [Clostridia bacterium]
MTKPTINLMCQDNSKLLSFLEKFYNKKFDKSIENFSFENPIEMIDLLSAIIDNNDKYNISAWINLDEDLFLKVTNSNLNEIVKYLYERYPY